MRVPVMFQPYCEELGVKASYYPEDSLEVMQNMGSGLGSLKGAFAFFSQSAAQQFDFMLEAAQDADGLITTINEVAAPTIAEYFKIPHYRIGFSPVLPGRQAPPFMPWQNMPVILNLLGWKGLNRFSQIILNKFVNPKRKELGLKPTKDSKHYHTGNSHTILAINKELAPPCKSWKDQYSYDYSGYCYGQIDGKLEKGLKGFIDSGEPPVYVGFGSVQIENAEEFTRLIVEASERSKTRVVVGAGWTGLGNGHLNAHVYCTGDTHHGTLFPKLAGVVHHGGSGTTHTAARAGFPSLYFHSSMTSISGGMQFLKMGWGLSRLFLKK